MVIIVHNSVVLSYMYSLHCLAFFFMSSLCIFVCFDGVG